jgi:hypothetical protein
MGFFSNFMGSNSQSSLQQEANQNMLKMLQERLATATCPTERQQIQDNIKQLQNGLQPSNIAPPSPTPNTVLFGGAAASQSAPQIVTKPPLDFSQLDNEMINLKASLLRLENIIKNLRNS